MSLDVEDVLGISIPFVLLFMSSIALGWAVEPSVLIAKLCVKPVRGSSPDVAILIKKKRTSDFMMNGFTKYPKLICYIKFY